MIVINISNVPPKLRGFLTKYLWEIDTGTYVGNVNARIRELLWKRISDNNAFGRATMVFPADNEQGFDFYTLGSAWEPVDFEGLKLILRPNNNGTEKSAKSISGIPKRYVVLDLETTGLDIEKDRIIEIGAVRVIKGEICESFDRIIKTKIPDEIILLTGITQEMADGGVDIVTAIEELKLFIGEDITIGFNIRMFDLKMIKKECMRHDLKNPLKQITDVYEIVKKECKGAGSYSLRSIAGYYGINVENEKHRAVNDCILCNEVYKSCLK